MIRDVGRIRATAGTEHCIHNESREEESCGRNLLVVALSTCVVLFVASSVALAADNGWAMDLTSQNRSSARDPRPRANAEIRSDQDAASSSVRTPSDADANPETVRMFSSSTDKDVPWKGNPDARHGSASGSTRTYEKHEEGWR